MAPQRDPETTRKHILDVAAREILLQGYKAASLADILASAGVSKGALYHHFSNKKELGYAVFEEVFVKRFIENWNFSVSGVDPIEGLCEVFNRLALNVTEEELRQGCPICNIAMEMSGVDEGFRLRACEMYKQLAEKLRVVLSEAKDSGLLRDSVDADAVATFIVAVLQGMIIQGKYSPDVNVVRSTISCMVDYLRTLKNT